MENSKIIRYLVSALIMIIVPMIFLKNCLGYSTSNMEHMIAYDNHQRKIKNDKSADELLKEFASQLEVIKDENLRSCVADAIYEYNHTGGNFAKGHKLTNLKQLTRFWCDNQKIENLSGIEILQGLKEINFSNNKIKDFSPIEKLPNLKKMFFDKNPLATLPDVHYLKNLSFISLPEIPKSILCEDLDVLVGSSTLKIHHKDYLHRQVDCFGVEDKIKEMYFADENLKECIYENTNERYKYSTRSNSNIFNYDQINTLNCFDKNISNIDGIERFSGLENVVFSGNEIADVYPLTWLSNLRNLSITGNNSPINNLPTLADIDTLENLSLTLSGDFEIDCVELEYLIDSPTLNFRNGERLLRNMNCDSY